MNKFIVILLVLIAVSANAEIWFIQVPKEEAASFAQSLDYLKPDSPYTTRYTLPIYSPIATVATALVPVDKNASGAVTAEQWANKLATMPEEFIPQLPVASEE